MQYLVIAYDYKDAIEKRLAVREEHVKATRELMKQDKILNAAAIIEDDKMIGSTIFTNFETQNEFDKWIQNEPYAVNGVWDIENIKVVPIKVLPKEN